VHLEASLRRRERSGCGAPAEDFQRLLLGCACELAAGGADGALVRLNPLAWRRRGVPFDVQAAILGAVVARSLERWDLTVRWYVTLKRETGEAELAAAVAAAVQARAAGVIGVDVSRSYALVDPRRRPLPSRCDERALAAAVADARAAELAVAVHCGWYDGRRELEQALAWGATRIGHGTPLGGAPDLLAELSRRQVTIEVCPTAFEWRTGRRLHELPVGDWLAAGIAVEVGTDHPRALGTDLRAEARKLADAVPRWRETALGGAA
jgi:aminodeoxyfutalosine deaminase